MEELRLSVLAGGSVARPALLAGLAALSLLAAGCNSRESSPAPSAEGAPVAAEPAAPEADDCRVAPPPGPIACTMEWNPVCGCDGKTYGNACEAKAAGVSRFTAGECGGSGLD